MSGAEGDSAPLLEVRDLRTHFFLRRGVVRAVDGVSLRIERGETLGLVGESGCGKSVTALSLLRLVAPPGRIVSGSILFRGVDLARLAEKEIRRIRGNDISIVFQEPMTALNPVFTIGSQIAEAVRCHQRTSRKEAAEEAVRMLRAVSIPDPRLRAGEYPHQMSGGMRQRALIAMALACKPALLIADEPTTALDVTIQAEILDLLRRLQGEMGLSILLITHDLGVIAEMADRIAVMYCGKIVEEAPVRSLFRDPKHPYTQALMKAIPRAAGAWAPGRRREPLLTIDGSVPDPLDLPPGCSFAPRCPSAHDRCLAAEPLLAEIVEGEKAACFLYPQVDGIETNRLAGIGGPPAPASS